jgi:hypothetical protein
MQITFLPVLLPPLPVREELAEAFLTKRNSINWEIYFVEKKEKIQTIDFQYFKFNLLNNSREIERSDLSETK